MDQTPFAYSGGCAVEPVGQDWLHRRGQGYRQPHLDNRVYPANRPPVACYNLEASTGTYAASAPQPGEHYVTATANDGTGFYDTTKIWLQVTALPGGDYELTWGTEKGVSVEWFLAEIDDPVVGLKIFSASSRHYRWRPFRDHTYPMFAVYANDTQAPPGKYMAIMGPPDPQP